MIIQFSFIICLLSYVESLLTNLTHINHDLPEIIEGERCTPGSMYRMSCNTCQCGDYNSLICTKMACIDGSTIDELKHRKEKQSLRRDNIEPREMLELPKGECTSGKFYKKGCQVCFCNELKILSCINYACTAKLTLTEINNDDILEAMKSTDMENLPVLPHMASDCQKGKFYVVACNFCICLESGDLMCTSRLCATPEGFAKVAAFQNSGKPCGSVKDQKLKCIECDCVERKTKCSAIPGCKIFNIKFLSGSNNIKLSMDAKKDKCTPKMMYRVNCNNCYCQEDGTLRCTQKICLKNSEAKKLKQQRLYLEKNRI